MQCHTWLRLLTRRLQVTILNSVIGIFHSHNPSGHTMALGSTQPLKEMNISLGVMAAGAYGWQPYQLNLPTVSKSGSLNVLECSGSVIDLYRDCFTSSQCTDTNTSALYSKELPWRWPHKLKSVHARSKVQLWLITCVLCFLHYHLCLWNMVKNALQKCALPLKLLFKCQQNTLHNLELPDSSSGSQDNLYHQHHCHEETCCLTITAKVARGKKMCMLCFVLSVSCPPLFPLHVHLLSLHFKDLLFHNCLLPISCQDHTLTLFH